MSRSRSGLQWLLDFREFGTLPAGNLEVAYLIAKGDIDYDPKTGVAKITKAGKDRLAEYDEALERAKNL